MSRLKKILRHKRYRNIFWFIAIVMVSVTLFVDFASQSLPLTVNTDRIHERLDKSLKSTRDITATWLTSDDKNLVSKLQSLDNPVDDNPAVSIMLLQNDTIVYWSSNPFHTDLTPLLLTDNKGILDIEGRQVLIFNKRNTMGRVAAAIVILTDAYESDAALFSNQSLTFYNQVPISVADGGSESQWSRIDFQAATFWVALHSSTVTPFMANIIGWVGLLMMLVLCCSSSIGRTNRQNAVGMWLKFLLCLTSVRVLMMFLPFNITSGSDMVPYFMGWRDLLFSPFNLLVTSIYILALSYYYFSIRNRFRYNAERLGRTAKMTLHIFSILLRSTGLLYFHWALIENIYSDAIEVEFFRLFSINTAGILVYISVGIYMTARLFQCNLNRATKEVSSFVSQLLISLAFLLILFYFLRGQLHNTGWMLLVYSVLFRGVGLLWRRYKPTTLFSISVALTALYFTTLTIWENNVAKHDKANEYLNLLIVNRNNTNFVEPAAFTDYSYAYLSPYGLKIKSNNQSELSRIQPFAHIDTMVVTGRYTHLIHPLNNQSIVVSYRESSLMDWLSMFCYLFLLFFVLSSLLFRTLGVYTREQIIMRKSLVVKIQFTMVIIIVVVVVAISLVSVNFSILSSSYTQRQLLNNKIRTLSTNLNLYQTDDMPVDNMLKDWYERSGKTLGYDLAIYSAQGILLSDNDGFRSARLLDSRAIASVIYRKAPYYVTSNNAPDKSLLVIYLPAYYQQTLIGFMCVAFTDPQDRTPVYPVVEGMFNIFVIILVAMLLLSMWMNRRVTRPIEILHEAMATVGLMRKIPEDQASRMDSEIYKLIRQYNKMIDYLEESYAAMARYEREGAWQEMARRMAHEIKNPLTPMKLKVQMLQRFRKEGRNDLELKTDETLKLLLEQIDIIADVVDEFRDFASMRENNPSIINLCTVVGDVAQLYDKYENVEIRYVDRGCAEPIWVYADGKQISRVVGNLCKNAVESIYHGSQGIVIVSLTKNEGKMAEIRIMDNGRGVNSEVAERLFEPNFTTKDRGSGLGLVISKQIIEEYGGSIWFENNPFGGATFVLTLPLRVNM